MVGVSAQATERTVLSAGEHRVIASHFRYAASLMESPRASGARSNWTQGLEEGFAGAREVLLELANRHEKLAARDGGPS